MSDTTSATETAPAPVGDSTPQNTTPTPSPGGFMGGANASPAAATSEPAKSGWFGDHVQKGGQFNEGWTESLREAGFERLATKAATAKDEATLMRMMDDTLGFVGKKSTGISYPKAGASEDDIASFRRDAGVPDDLEGYAYKPEKLPEGVQWDESAMKPYAEIFHKHHIPVAAAQELIQKHIDSLGGQRDGAFDAFNVKVAQFAQASEQTFQKEWGDHYDSRLEANRAFVQSRFAADELADPAMQAALSHPKVVRVIDEARRALREAPLPGVGNEVANGSHSPRQQATEIMKANPKWRNDPDASKRVMALYELDAAQSKRAGR